MRFERGGETLLSAVGCPLSAGEGDGQTVRRQTGMVPGNVFPTYGKSHKGRRFQGSARNDMKGRSAARVQMVQRFKGWWWRLRRSIQAPSWGRGLTLRVFTAASYAVGCVEAGDFGAPLPTLEMTGGGAFRMKMTKRSVNGKILFPKLWKMKSFGNRIFTLRDIDCIVEISFHPLKCG